MKARVIATGKIVYVEKNINYYRGGYVASNGKIYNACDLELVVDDESNYWIHLEHQYAGMAMQGILSNPNITYKDISTETICNHVAERVKEIAHALVEKMKEEK